MLNICTWFCADEPGEDSKYAQMRGKSSDKSFQAVYWRNIYLFFLTSKIQNPYANHVLFTNVDIPIIDRFDYKAYFVELEVDVYIVKFAYRTPPGYYSAWRNQFFEFSILDYISSNFSPDEYWLILDSDCVFTKSVEYLPKLSESSQNILTYILIEPEGSDINGLTQSQMKNLYEDLLNEKLTHEPHYHAGEFYFSNGYWVKKFSKEFSILWPIMLERHQKNQTKLTEEAHVLSFLYFKNRIDDSGTANNIIKRLWTQPFIHRNVNKDDDLYPIWHLPHEKRYGLKTLFFILSQKSFSYWKNYPSDKFLDLFRYHLTVPTIPVSIYAKRLIPIQTARIIYYGIVKFRTRLFK